MEDSGGEVRVFSWQVFSFQWGPRRRKDDANCANFREWDSTEAGSCGEGLSLRGL